MQNPKKKWLTQFSSQKDIFFPAEYVIRIFKGNYPKLNLNKQDFRNKKICDIGCGDGRNLVLLNQCNFNVHGTEISEDILEEIKKRMKKSEIKCNLKVGTNNNLPFEKNYFDYLLSWNSCYYTSEPNSFESHVEEFSRILKPNGYLILSIPKKTCFIFSESERVYRGYQRIKKDPFNVRNGEILRMFNDEKEIKEEFSRFFTDFTFASIEDDCFGLNYHWHLIICKNK